MILNPSDMKKPCTLPGCTKLSVVYALEIIPMVYDFRLYLCHQHALLIYPEKYTQLCEAMSRD